MYEGELDNNQKRNGYGRLIDSRGNYYIGYWKDNKMDGQGKKVNVSTNLIQEGNWKNGEFKS